MGLQDTKNTVVVFKHFISWQNCRLFCSSVLKYSASTSMECQRSEISRPFNKPKHVMVCLLTTKISFIHLSSLTSTTSITIFQIRYGSCEIYLFDYSWSKRTHTQWGYLFGLSVHGGNEHGHEITRMCPVVIHVISGIFWGTWHRSWRRPHLVQSQKGVSLVRPDWLWAHWPGIPAEVYSPETERQAFK